MFNFLPRVFFLLSIGLTFDMLQTETVFFFYQFPPSQQNKLNNPDLLPLSITLDGRIRDSDPVFNPAKHATLPFLQY